jgi:MYXO-CTERM domain-containing protein
VVGVLAWLGLLWAGSHADRAAAHGAPPAALSILDRDARGPRMVRLTGGLAQRDAAGGSYRMICPAAWGDDLALPAISLSSGSTVIAGGQGLMLLARDGVASAHPDPLAAGPSSDLARLGDQIFALRTRAGRSELLAVDASHVTLMFSDSAPWSSLAATEDSIGLQRLEDGRLEQLRLAADGTQLGRESAPAPMNATFVSARATGRELYALVGTAFGRELGRIEADRFQPLATAEATIAGPVELADGRLLVAIDSIVSELADGDRALRPLADLPPVSCLARTGADAYACTREGVIALAGDVVGAELFQLARLQPPDLQRVAEAQRALCGLQWEHFRFELLTIGIEVEADVPAGEDHPRRDAGASADAAAADGGEPPSLRDPGCDCRAAPGAPRTQGGAWWVLLAVALGLWRRPRARARVLSRGATRPR